VLIYLYRIFMQQDEKSDAKKIWRNNLDI
jgi:hypothetical protein